jgi:predicted ATP-grasp superfamily ATP-dependent carboligase
LARAKSDQILLAGISVRMLAELALRAGYRVMALDYFGDSDLQALCPNKSLLRDYETAYTPAALVDAAGELTAPYVVYSASLENHPDQIARLQQDRQLWGNSPETLQRVRQPALLAEALRQISYPFPQTIFSEQAVVPAEGRRWLCKPLKSGGGHAIRRWTGEPLADKAILQEQLAGLAGSAVFVANGRQAILLGITEQLVGESAFGATGFRYCGNLLPPRLETTQRHELARQLREIISHLTAEFKLRGLNGLDFIWHNGRIWTLEVNPRPPASLELIDTAYEIRVFEAHVHSFEGKLPDFELETVISGQVAAGKAILYATQDVTVGDTRHWLACGIRDIPHVDEQIQQPHPICTIITTSATPAGCLEILETQAARVRSWLKPLS